MLKATILVLSAVLYLLTPFTYKQEFRYLFTLKHDLLTVAVMLTGSRFSVRARVQLQDHLVSDTHILYVLELLLRAQKLVEGAVSARVEPARGRDTELPGYLVIWYGLINMLENYSRELLIVK